MNRRLFKGLQISGQQQFVVSGLGFGLHHRDGRNRDGFGFFRKRVGFGVPVQKSNCAGGDQNEQYGANQNLSPTHRSRTRIGPPLVLWADGPRLVLLRRYRRRLY